MSALLFCCFPVFACKWSNGIRRSLTARTEAVVDPEVSRSICQDVGILQPTSGSQDFRWGPLEWGLMRFYKDLLDSWKSGNIPCVFSSLRKLISSYIAALALLAFLAVPSSANFLLNIIFCLVFRVCLNSIKDYPFLGNGTGRNIGRQPSRVFMLGLAGMASNMPSFGSLSFADPFWCVAVWLYFRTLAFIDSSIHSFVCSFSCQKSWCASGMFARCLLFLKLREQWEQREQNREPKRNDLDLDQKFPINFQPFACAGHWHLLGWLWASAGGYCSYRSYPSLEIGSGAGVHHAEGFQWQCLRSSGGQLTFFTWRRSFQLLWTVVSSILKPYWWEVFHYKAGCFDTDAEIVRIGGGQTNLNRKLINPDRSLLTDPCISGQHC